MMTLERTCDDPYRCDTGLAALAEVANGEKLLPDEWIGGDGFSLTQEFLRYARPLIQGELPAIIEGGLPQFVRLKKKLI